MPETCKQQAWDMSWLKLDMAHWEYVQCHSELVGEPLQQLTVQQFSQPIRIFMAVGYSDYSGKEVTLFYT